MMIIVRGDLPNGYQIAQSTHSMAKFAYDFPVIFKEWYEDSQYIICLSIDNEEKLKHLYDKLKWRGANVTQFREPDIDNQLTSICYLGTPELIKTTNKLKLALKN